MKLYAVLPVLLPIYFDLDATIAFGGTSIIILVGVASETYEQIKAKMAGSDSGLGNYARLAQHRSSAHK